MERRAYIPIALSSKDVTRFKRYVDSSGGDHACWPWIGALGGGDNPRQQYGAFRMIHGNLRPNRVAHYLHTGIDPEDLQVCHSCDNPRCCNPAHLFLGDAKANADDRERKGRGIFGKTHPRAKLTEEQVCSIREMYAMGGYTCKSLAGVFNVKAGTIANVISCTDRKQAWKSVEFPDHLREAVWVASRKNKSHPKH